MHSQYIHTVAFITLGAPVTDISKKDLYENGASQNM